MDSSPLILVAFPEAREFILHAEDDENIEGLEKDAQQ
jgi:hypothetical protein